jgi:hypothetical protein
LDPNSQPNSTTPSDERSFGTWCDVQTARIKRELLAREEDYARKTLEVQWPCGVKEKRR